MPNEIYLKELENLSRYDNKYFNQLKFFLKDVKNENYISPDIKGAITFLDVLGWKGIYKNRKTALIDLLNLVEDTKKYAKKITSDSEINGSKDHGKETYVISISDTIAILTEGDACSTIKIHAEICNKILPISVSSKIPLRGAISYGNYKFQDNVMVGPAVDEAASWHESTEWIGVILAPTAQIHLSNGYSSPIISYDQIPFKRTFKPLNTCISWELPNNIKREELILEMGPLVPEIAGKYMNTFNFLDFTQRINTSPDNDPQNTISHDLVLNN